MRHLNKDEACSRNNKKLKEAIHTENRIKEGGIDKQETKKLHQYLSDKSKIRIHLELLGMFICGLRTKQILY